MVEWKCQGCGFVFDEEGEGIPFIDLPDEWACPGCHATKGGFLLEEEDDHPPEAS